MEDEKAGEPFQWQQALDSLSVLPGEATLDKEAAWDKLQMRFGKRPQKNRFVLYWAAAAATLLFVMAIWWMRGKQPYEQLTAGKQIPHPATRPAVPVHREPQQDLVIIPQTPQKTGSTVALKMQHPAHATAPVLQPAAVPVKQALPGTASPAIAVQITPVTDTQHALAMLPVQKKLRIVHLNELGVAPAETPVAQTTGAPYLQAKLSTGEDLSRFYITRNTSDNIVKVKLSSN